MKPELPRITVAKAFVALIFVPPPQAKRDDGAARPAEPAPGDGRNNLEAK